MLRQHRVAAGESMSQRKTPKRGNPPTDAGPRYVQDFQIDEPLLYFLACRDLRSDQPAVRRPAITVLLALAGQAAKPIRARACKVLAKEFGPYVVTHGLKGCAAPLSVFCDCLDEGPRCNTCPWQWSYEDSPQAAENVRP